MRQDSRRIFLKKSLFGISGAAFFPGAFNKSHTVTFELNSESELPCRILGKTGLKVPVISMGAGGASSEGLVKAAFDAGIRLFFSATYYGEGNNEKMLGDAIRELPRDSLIIGTAIIPEGIDHRAGLYTKESTYDGMMKKTAESLKRFGLDNLDIMFLPYAGKRESIFFEPLLRAMEDLKKQGKARFIGIITHSFQEEAIKAAADAKIYDLAMLGYNFRSTNQKEINEAIAYATKAGLGIIGMKTQAGGYWDKERTQPINSDAALKWVLQNENISTIASGMTNYDELEKNLILVKSGLDLTDEEKKDLRLASLQEHPGLWCKQCHQCISQCKKALDIPSIMRSYMYAYGYRNLEHAWYTLNDTGLAGFSCDDCSSCSVKCPAGFNVREKIQDIARLKDVPGDFLIS